MNDTTERELLELAASAVGFRITWGEKYILGDDEVDCTDLPYIVGADREEADSYWNPLEDDGDALRLVSKLRIPLMFIGPCVYAGALLEEIGDDANAATRHAIVRAAAIIGKEMP